MHRVAIPFDKNYKKWMEEYAWRTKFGIKATPQPETAEHDMCKWIRSNCKGIVYAVRCFKNKNQDTVFEFFFPNLSDAILFKLNYSG